MLNKLERLGYTLFSDNAHYTFFGHLKWTPVIALGYMASIATHMWINARYF